MKRYAMLLSGVFSLCMSVVGAGTDWRAQWIWLPEHDPAEMMLARTVFEVSTLPDKANLSITAGSRYELYVNARLIGRGPARSAPHHQSYDVFDVSGMLQPGRNAIAVRVHFQEGETSFYEASRAGLLVQLDGLPEKIQSDASWKVSADRSWNNEAVPMARFHPEQCDDVDLRKTCRGWMTLDYDDRDWAKAAVLKRTVGWPSPQKNERPGHLIPPWTALVERDIPYLNEVIIKAGAPVANAVNVLGTGKCRVEVYDFGRVVYGRPSLEIEAPEGTVVEIMSAPYLLNGEIRKTIAASHYTDRMICSGERDQWTAFYEKPVRWLAVVFRTAAEDAVLHEVSIRRSAYPFVEKGDIQLPSAPGLETLWHASAETIRVCTSDAYTDNYRERRQYAQTAYYACLGNYPVFGDTALQRRYLIQIAQEQQANGMMPAYAPRHGGDFMVILDSNCFWIRGLYQYLIHSGEVETVRRQLPAARKLMDLFAGYSNQDGLIDSPPYPYWLDHAVQDRRGANFCLNGHYLGAVEDFAAVLQFFGEEDAGAFAALGQRMRTGLTEFYVEDRGLFCDAMIDGVHSEQFSEHANAMALAMGIASPEQQKIIAEKLLAAGAGDFVKHDDGMIMVTPAMSYFLHKGLCEAGFIDESFALLQERFSHMLEEEYNGTLWEEWWLDATGRSGKRRPFPAGRSDAQTESAFPPALMTEYLLGIKAVSPGMQRIKLKYYASERVLHRKGSVPTPRGLITLEWKEDASSIELNLTIPEDTEVALDRAGLGRPDSRHMRVNGEKKSVEGACLKLSQGTYRIVVER